jgi:hypothetical protein
MTPPEQNDEPRRGGRRDWASLQARVVICGGELPDGDWRMLLGQIQDEPLSDCLLPAGGRPPVAKGGAMAARNHPGGEPNLGTEGMKHLHCRAFEQVPKAASRLSALALLSWPYGRSELGAVTWRREQVAGRADAGPVAAGQRAGRRRSPQGAALPDLERPRTPGPVRGAVQPRDPGAGLSDSRRQAAGLQRPGPIGGLL